MNRPTWIEVFRKLAEAAEQSSWNSRTVNCCEARDILKDWDDLNGRNVELEKEVACLRKRLTKIGDEAAWRAGRIIDLERAARKDD